MNCSAKFCIPNQKPLLETSRPRAASSVCVGCTDLLRSSLRIASGIAFSLAWVVVFFSGPGRLAAAELKPETVQAFNQYLKQAEFRTNSGLEPDGAFLWMDSLSSADRSADYARLRNGEILVHSFAAGKDVPDGMIHDWVGVVFIPGATIDGVLAQMKDYGNYAKIYHPEIIRSKLLDHDGNNYKVSLWLCRKSLVTVVLDVEENLQYFKISPLRAYSRSQSTRIAEVENYGTPEEHESPAGTGHGYMWKMYSYSRFLQDSGGVYLQFEVIALSRNIPWGLGWLIKPFVTNIPKEALTFTLARSRAAIEAAKTALSMQLHKNPGRSDPLALQF